MVGVAGRSGEKTVLEFAFQEASLRHTRLPAVHAWTHPVSVGPGDMLPLVHDVGSVGEEEARSLAETLAGWRRTYPDIDLVEEVVHGSAGEALVEASSNADLVVIGARSGLRGTVLPPPSKRLAEHRPHPHLRADRHLTPRRLSHPLGHRLDTLRTGNSTRETSTGGEAAHARAASRPDWSTESAASLRRALTVGAKDQSSSPELSSRRGSTPRVAPPPPPQVSSAAGPPAPAAKASAQAIAATSAGGVSGDREARHGGLPFQRRCGFPPCAARRRAATTPNICGQPRIRCPTPRQAASCCPARRPGIVRPAPLWCGVLRPSPKLSGAIR
ncbi:universal stress protein [Sphaerisporangium sp. NBC_01403]|uniref:universal stress protein n=1 Tax=Sphaerisporangium sp. NBC_01403 TaxID=2903599 RepID=UPI003865FA3B